MSQQAVLIPCNAHLVANAAGNLRARLGMVAALLLSGGCAEFRVPDPNVIYVAIGDSSTSGPSTRDYPDILQELLDVAPDTFANEGGSGETSEEGLDHLTFLLEEEIFPNAEVLLYWMGGNDIAEFIKDHDPFLLASPDDPDYPLTKASNKAWYEALRKAKLVGFRWHDLRHTFASWAVMSGVSLLELQRLGGWKTSQMVAVRPSLGRPLGGSIGQDPADQPEVGYAVAVASWGGMGQPLPGVRRNRL